MTMNWSSKLGSCRQVSDYLTKALLNLQSSWKTIIYPSFIPLAIADFIINRSIPCHCDPRIQKGFIIRRIRNIILKHEKSWYITFVCWNKSDCIWVAQWRWTPPSRATICFAVRPFFSTFSPCSSVTLANCKFSYGEITP